jgi:hypothetical protein
MKDLIIQPSSTSEIPPKKRQPGILDNNNNWLVLTESTRQKDGTWVHKCGSPIDQKVLHQTVYDGLFLLSGSGEVRTMHIPYCPNCETEPDIH